MRPMRTNLEYLTDDELVLECMDLLKLMMKENNTQTIIMVFLIVYNFFSFLGYINLGFAWFLTQIMCWGLYFYHSHQYNKKRKDLRDLQEEMIKREIL